MNNIEFTNNLRYTHIRKNEDKTWIQIKIRLNDDCKNGHEDFSITGTLSTIRNFDMDKYIITCGCIHDEIMKYCPQFKLFIDLHLADFRGVPMHAVENGFYHLEKGFNQDTTKFNEYYRMSKDQYNIIKHSETKTQYNILLHELGIVDNWKLQANEAIEVLESLVNEKNKRDGINIIYKFKSTGDKIHNINLSNDIINDFKEKEASGYYSKENKLKRSIEAKKQTKIEKQNKIKTDLKNSIDKLKLKAKIDLYICNNISYDYDNFIYYDHTKNLNFNWNNNSYNKEITKQQFKTFVKKAKKLKLFRDINITFEGK